VMTLVQVLKTPTKAALNCFPFYESIFILMDNL
jgi:hypothetical protein